MFELKCWAMAFMGSSFCSDYEAFQERKQPSPKPLYDSLDKPANPHGPSVIYQNDVTRSDGATATDYEDISLTVKR